MPDDLPQPTTDRPTRRFTARDSIVCVGVAALLLVVCAGDSVRRAGEEMDKGIIRSVVLAVGHPTGWIADQLPFASAADQVAGWLSSEDDLGSGDGTLGAREGQTGGGAIARVPPSAFSSMQLGGPDERRGLRTLLVTGDSLSQPLDAKLARGLAGAEVSTVREPHIGTGLSKPDLLDWGKLARKQTAKVNPDAVVLFIGANEGFPMTTPKGTVQCCGPEWAAEYATRARGMIDSYRRDGATQVYWLLLPAPRDPRRQPISRAVNAAIRVAAGAYGAEVRVVDTERIFTPQHRYRDAMDVDGRQQIVRESDGIHLNELGAEIAAKEVEAQLAAVFDLDAAPS